MLLPNAMGKDSNSTFYIEDKDRNFLLEDDNFFEDMTLLYQRQKVLFQRSCEQLKVYNLLTLIKSNGMPTCVSVYKFVCREGSH